MSHELLRAALAFVSALAVIVLLNRLTAPKRR